MFYLGSSLFFIVCAFFIFLFEPHFKHWDSFFVAYSLISIIAYVFIGTRLDYNDNLPEFLRSVSIPSLVGFVIWFFLCLSSLSGGGGGALGNGIGWIFYFPFISHSLFVFLFKGAVDGGGIFLLLPFNFLPMFLFIAGRMFSLRSTDDPSVR